MKRERKCVRFDISIWNQRNTGRTALYSHVDAVSLHVFNVAKSSLGNDIQAYFSRSLSVSRLLTNCPSHSYMRSYSSICVCELLSGCAFIVHKRCYWCVRISKETIPLFGVMYQSESKRDRVLERAQDKASIFFSGINVWERCNERKSLQSIHFQERLYIEWVGDEPRMCVRYVYCTK